MACLEDRYFVVVVEDFSQGQMNTVRAVFLCWIVLRVAVSGIRAARTRVLALIVIVIINRVIYLVVHFVSFVIASIFLPSRDTANASGVAVLVGNIF